MMKPQTQLSIPRVWCLGVSMFFIAPACGGDSKPAERYGIGLGGGIGKSSGGFTNQGGANAARGGSGGATSQNSVPGTRDGSGGATSQNLGGSLAVSTGVVTGGASSAISGAGRSSQGRAGAPSEPAGGGTVSGGSVSGSCDEYEMPADCVIPSGAVLPGELRCTGLYSDWQARKLRCGVTAYTPAHQLWTDGAGKQRYVWLPPNGRVDVSDPESFVYPVGTRFWKEFHVGAERSQRLGETRYLLKVKGGWLYTAYVWSEDGTSAIQTNEGVTNLFDTGHSVPTRDQCKTCHGGRPDFVLGWDFIMLGPGASGVTTRQLAEQERLAGLEPTLLERGIPGDEVERAALSYLHANCGVSCHNQTSNAVGKPSGLFLRLELDKLGSVHSTDAATSGINRLPSPNANYRDVASPGGDFYDFRPLDPSRSLSLARMAYRGSVTAMPPIGTHRIHPDGLARVRAWIESMTTERGYPAPAP